MTVATKPENPLLEYRKWLVAAEQKSQEDFDKTVLSLSGGALGISFVFLKDVIGPNPIQSPTLLFLAWVAWALSTFAVLLSFHLSHLALRKAIAQVDAGSIHQQKAGGVFSSLTKWLNLSGAILFLVGVLCITMFASVNLSTKGVSNGNKQTAPAAITPTTPTTPATGQTQSPSNNGGLHPSPTTSTTK
jgi:hypothetical protein